MSIPVMGVSMNERCIGAKMKGPGGKFSLPSTRSLNSSLTNTNTKHQKNL